MPFRVVPFSVVPLASAALASTMPADELPAAVPEEVCPGAVPFTSEASALSVVRVPAVPVPSTVAASVLPVTPPLVVVVVGTLPSTVTVPSAFTTYCAPLEKAVVDDWMAPLAALVLLCGAGT